MILGLAVGALCGTIVGAIGADRHWSTLRTSVTAVMIALPLLTIITILRSA